MANVIAPENKRCRVNNGRDWRCVKFFSSANDMLYCDYHTTCTITSKRGNLDELLLMPTGGMKLESDVMVLTQTAESRSVAFLYRRTAKANTKSRYTNSFKKDKVASWSSRPTGDHVLSDSEVASTVARGESLIMDGKGGSKEVMQAFVSEHPFFADLWN